MNEELLAELFSMIPEGVFEDLEDFQEAIERDGIEEIYPMIPEGVFEDEDQFIAYAAPLTDPVGQKKKDTSSQQPGLNMASEDPGIVQTTQEGTGSSGLASPLSNQLVETDLVGQQIDYIPENPVGTRYGANVQVGEKNTWLEEMLGKNVVTDFFGDMWRAGKQGIGQGATVDDALKLYASGSSISDEDLQEYIAAVGEMDNIGMSDEMRSFNKIYENNGGGVLGFVLGVGANPTVLGQLFVSSIASMVNPAVAAGAGAGAATGAGVGAAAGAVGGPLAAITAAGGAITGTLMGAGATLETGLSFTEFLKEEVQKKGLTFNEEGIRAVLEDEEALQNVRNNSAARGIAIGVVDGLTRGIAGKIAGKGVKAAKAAGKTVSAAQKARAGLGAALIEGVGGSTGEVAGRAVSGQEMDTAEILFEGVTGQASSVLSVPQAITGKTATELLNVNVPGINIFKPPKYGLKDKSGNVTKMSKQDLEKFINTATPDQIRTMQFEIKNDPELQKIVQDKQQAAQIGSDIPPFIVGKDRAKMIALEQEKSNMKDPNLKVNKKRLADIEAELDGIIQKYEGVMAESVTVTDDKGNTSTETIAVTKDFAIQQLEADGITDPTEEQISSKQTELFEQAKKDVSESGNFVRNQAVNQLASDGIVNPTEEQIIEKINAIQESSTETVDVQESTRDSQEVGEGDTQLTEATEPGETQIEDQVGPGIRPQTQEEIAVNVAPFFATSVDNVAEAGGVRKTPQYQQYKQGLIDLANDLGVEIEVDESVGGYVNDAGTKIREVSNVVRLQDATLDQAKEYAALAAALAPEVQESSIAAETTEVESPTHNADAVTIRVSDPQATFEALQEVGIDEYTLNESNNLLTLLDVHEFRNDNFFAQREALLQKLDEKNVQYELGNLEALNSEYLGRDSRRKILSDARQRLIQQGQEETNLYSKVLSAINRDAEALGISPNEYIQIDVTEQQVTADPQRVQTIINEIIEKTKGRKAGESTNPKVLLDNTLKYLQNSKLYQQLDDISRNDLVRQLNEQLGIKIKRPPSVKKILGKPADKKVVVNERTALKDQIKRQAKAARESAAAYKKALQNIAAEIKGLRKAGKVSQAKVAAITSRFANVNLNNKKSVDNFLSFVDNVFTKADFAEKIARAKKLQKRAKKNIKSKIGVVSKDLEVSLKEVLGFSPSIIPPAQLNSYLQLMEEFGASKAVLDLKQSSETLQQALDIINAVEAEVDTNENLAIDNETTPDDYDVKANVAEAKAINITSDQIENIVDPRSKELARTLSKLTSKEIEGLARQKKDGTMDYSAIETLKAVKKNIQNGYVPKAAMKLVNKVDINNRQAQLDPVIGKVKKEGIYRNLRSAYQKIKSLKTGKSFLLERLRSGPLFNVDDVFGNFNSKTIYNNTFGRLGKAFETYKSETKKETAKVDAADNILEFDGVNKVRRATRTGRSRNAIVKSKYKIRMLQLQREYLSNFKDGKPNSKAPSALDFVDATLQAIKNKDILSAQDEKILQDLRAEFLEGEQLSLEKLENSLTPGEKKALALYDEVNNSLAEKAMFISTMHGNQVDLLNNYNHHAVINVGNDAVTELNNKTKEYVDTVNGATNAGTIKERTAGAKPISFDPSYSAIRGVQQTNMDYYMTQTLQQVGGLLNKMKTDLENNPNASKASVTAANALVKAMNEVVENVFMQSYTDIGIMDSVIQKVKRIGYQSALASAPRAMSELVGNFAMYLSNPARGMRALKNFGGLSTDPRNTTLGFDILTALGSGVTSKLFDSDALQSKYSDMSDFATPKRSSGQAVSRMENVLGQLAKFSGVKQAASIVNQVANKTLSYPDQILSRPMWFGSFADAFAEKTGIKLTSSDFKKIADGTSEYLGPEFKEAREFATAKADGNVVIMATSSNPFDGILKNTPKTTDSGFLPWYKMVNSYMQRFTLFEYGTARNAIGALYKKGDISKAEAIGLLTGVTVRMSSYMVIYGALTGLLDDELFDAKDERKEEEDLEDTIVRQLVGSVTGLIAGGTLGNIAKIPVNFMLEYGINEPYLDDFRKGEYDPFVHSMVFSQLSMEDLQKGDLFEAFTKVGLGPFGPLVNTLRRAGIVTARSLNAKKPETRAKYKEELEERMVVEMLGNLGLLPFYKDIRRIILKDMFGKKTLTPAQRKAIQEYMKTQKVLPTGGAGASGKKAVPTKKVLPTGKQTTKTKTTRKRTKRLSKPLSRGLN